MAKYDIENLLADTLKIVNDNLNVKLRAISAEKADGLNLLELDPAKCFFQDLDKSDAIAAPLFLFYGVDDPQVDGIGPASAIRAELFFILVLMDTGENKLFMTRLLRYMRAMQEIFQDNYDKIVRVGRISVSSLAPVSFTIQGGGSFKAVGVKLKASLA